MRQKKLVIISAGKLGREIHSWAEQAILAGTSWKIKGFLDNRPHLLDEFPGMAPILGSVEEYAIQPGDVFLCGVGNPLERKRYQEAMERRGGEFTRLIHPSTVIGPNVEIGEGTLVCPFCHLSRDIRVGRGVFLGPHGNFAHDTIFGDFSQLSGSCEVNGNAVVGEGVFVGSHATILPGASLGEWSYVGAHSLVLRRVNPHQKVFGVPAVPLASPVSTTS